MNNTGNTVSLVNRNYSNIEEFRSNLEQQLSSHDTIDRNPNNWSEVALYPYMSYNFTTTRWSNASSFNKKINKKNTLKSTKRTGNTLVI